MRLRARGRAASERGAARRASFVSRDGRSPLAPLPTAARTQPSVPSERPAQILSHRYHTLISRQALKPRTKLFSRPDAGVCASADVCIGICISVTRSLTKGGASTSRPGRASWTALRHRARRGRVQRVAVNLALSARAGGPITQVRLDKWRAW